MTALLSAENLPASHGHPRMELVAPPLTRRNASTATTPTNGMTLRQSRSVAQKRWSLMGWGPRVPPGDTCYGFHRHCFIFCPMRARVLHPRHTAACCHQRSLLRNPCFLVFPTTPPPLPLPLSQPMLSSEISPVFRPLMRPS